LHFIKREHNKKEVMERTKERTEVLTQSPTE
jgi:hypothetical protein